MFACTSMFFVISTSDSLAFSQKEHLKSWQEIRDYGVIKQQLDYSCGAASLATLLSLQPNLENDLKSNSYSETQILKLIKRKDASSFLDLKRVAKKFGYKAIGYKVNFDHLLALKVPVIVYLEHLNNPHFSVLKSLDTTFVSLADPAWGNLKLTHAQFLKKWTKNKFKTGFILVVFKP